MPKAAAPDYNQYVRAENEIHLDMVERKLKGAKYGSGAALRADIAQIAANAAAYNAPGCGRYGGPGGGRFHRNKCLVPGTSANAFVDCRSRDDIRSPMFCPSMPLKAVLVSRADIIGMAEILLAAVDAELVAHAAELAAAEAAVRQEDRAAALGEPKP